jgi:hypothetical protein
MKWHGAAFAWQVPGCGEPRKIREGRKIKKGTIK